MFHAHAPFRFAALAAVSALGLLPPFAAQAQQPGKTVVVEPTGQPVQASPFIPFGQWIEHVAPPVVVVVSAPATLQEFTPPSAPMAQPFEAAPIILGQPELPLLGQAAAQAAQQWNSGLNYQGMTLSYVVLDAAGKRREVRPIARGVAPGERFRVRYTTSYEAVTSIDQVVGDSPWRGQRVGQVWPQPGASVQSQPGETVELPLDPNAYFRFSGATNERYVLTVRHPRASAAARSNQPAYRQDGALGSQYLQLVPTGTHPAIEQVLAPRQGR